MQRLSKPKKIRIVDKWEGEVRKTLESVESLSLRKRKFQEGESGPLGQMSKMIDGVRKVMAEFHNLEIIEGLDERKEEL